MLMDLNAEIQIVFVFSWRDEGMITWIIWVYDNLIIAPPIII